MKSGHPYIWAMLPRAHNTLVHSFSCFYLLCLLAHLSEPLHQLLCMGVWCLSWGPLIDRSIFKVLLEMFFTLQYAKIITSWSSTSTWRLWSVWIESRWWLLWNYAVETCVLYFLICRAFISYNDEFLRKKIQTLCWAWISGLSLTRTAAFTLALFLPFSCTGEQIWLCKK